MGARRMADYSDPLPGSGVSFWSLAACLAGSLLSLRTVVETTPMARMLSVASAFLLAYFLAPAISDYWGMGPKMERGTMLLVAFLGVNLLAGISIFSQKFMQNPREAIEWALSLWRGTKP